MKNKNKSNFILDQKLFIKFDYNNIIIKIHLNSKHKNYLYKF